MLLPTTVIKSNPRSTVTSQISCSSTIVSRLSRSATELGGLSKVNDTEISDVVTKSTLNSCLAIISNTLAKKPWAYIILGVLTVTMTCSLRRVIAR